MPRIVIAISLALAGAALSLADIAAVRSALDSALAGQGGPSVSRADLVGLYGDDVKNGSQEEVRSLLTLAQKCLRSRVKAVQAYGLIVFFLATFRADGADLIAPHIDDIAPFLDDQDLAVKRNVILVLASPSPRLLPRALDLISAHLADKDNTEMEAGMIAATLIRGRPSDASSVRAVLDFVSGHPELKLRNRVIQTLGLNNVTTAEAVKFVRAGLSDGDPAVRRISAEAVGHMSAEGRAIFSADLLRLLANPDEDAEVRAAAQGALQQ